MPKPRRLFDCIEEQLKEGNIEAALVARENGAWRKYSSLELKEIVDKLATGLLALGISAGDMTVEGRDKIALLSKNRPEWMFLDLAVQKIGAVLVPVYPTVHPNDLQFVLNDAKVKLVFVNDEDLFSKMNNIWHLTPSVKDIYSFEEINGVKNWKEILELGKQEHYHQLDIASNKINTEDLFTIIYTSGTTGTPKGVMLSHHNVLSNVMSVLPHFGLDRATRVVSFLPLNHIFERMVTYLYLFTGSNIYYAESLETLGENLKDVKPHMFTTVPRLLEKIYEKILKKAQTVPKTQQKIFFWALRLAEQYDIHGSHSIAYKLQLALANKLVFKKWREGLGNELRFIVTGAAACPVKMIRIFTAAGISILEGYGQTESSPVICVNKLEKEGRKFGTVGPAIDGVEVKIAEDGEILCKGPNVMMGYYKRPDLTVETVIDGWLHTGDIGVLHDNKFLKITDRKKEIFKTSGGKYVAPQPIENKIIESTWVEQIMVVGADQKFAGALIVPSFSTIRDWVKQQGIEASTNDEIIHAPKVLKQFKEIIEQFNESFNHVEQIRKFELLPQEWSIEGGELTPTMKLKRKIIVEKYRDAIQRIYS